jgi:hypothetical protein
MMWLHSLSTQENEAGFPRLGPDDGHVAARTVPVIGRLP